MDQTQAQVVARGMRWNPEMAEKARQSHHYIKVGDKSGQLQITGAQNRWKKNAKDVYISVLRIAGDPEAIETALQSAGYSKSEIDGFFAQAYTFGNYNLPAAQGGMMEEFNRETDAYHAYKKENASTEEESAPVLRLEHLEALVATLPECQTTKATRHKAAAEGDNSASSKKGSRGAKEPLKDRLDRLPEGKCLDVSKMNLSNGSGVKSVETPGANSKKYHVQGLAVCSDNLEAYVAAVEPLGPEFAHFIESFRQTMANPPAPKPAKKAEAKPSAVKAPKVSTAPATKPVAVPSSKPAAVKAAPAAAASKVAPAAAPAAAAVAASAPKGLKPAPKLRMPSVNSPR